MARPVPLANIRTAVSSRFLTEEASARSPRDVDDIFHATHLHPYDTHDGHDVPLRPEWKRSLFELLERPTSSPSAFFLHVFITFLIVLSSIVTIVETIPAAHAIPVQLWVGFETSLVALFTVEYVLRCVAWSESVTSLVKWILSFYGLIDLLAILPFYIEIALQQDTSVLFRFSILRTFRLLRVFRPFRYNNTILLTIEVMYLSFRRSQHALLALSFFVAMVLTVFSTLLYFAERGTWDETLEIFINVDGDPSQFSSIPAAAWFVLVTITTVGYGEITPRSFLGRLITLPLLVFGLLLIALPSFVLGREFSLVWEKMSKIQLNGHVDEVELDSAPMDSFLSSSSSSRRERGPDLSNRKLAQNQTELSAQIADLRATIETQAKTMERLVAALEGASGSRVIPGMKYMGGDVGDLGTSSRVSGSARSS